MRRDRATRPWQARAKDPDHEARVRTDSESFPGLSCHVPEPYAGARTMMGGFAANEDPTLGVQP
jgi:hypothetical protein